MARNSLSGSADFGKCHGNFLLNLVVRHISQCVADLIQDAKPLFALRLQRIPFFRKTVPSHFKRLIHLAIKLILMNVFERIADRANGFPAALLHLFDIFDRLHVANWNDCGDLAPTPFDQNAGLASVDLISDLRSPWMSDF